MRTKILLGALLAGGLVVGGGIWMAGVLQAPPALASPNAPKTMMVQHPSPSAVPPEIKPVKVFAPRPDGDAPQPANPAPVEGILADLEKPGHELHKAALQRAREMDDRAIIPRLREIAGRTEDAEEKADILDTIEFLNLPSLDENMAQVRAARAAAGLPDLPQSATNRWTGQPFARPQ